MGEVITAKDKEYEAEERATAPGANQSMSDRVNNRSLRPQSAAFKEFMKSGWADDDPEINPLESSKFTPARLEALGKAFPGERLVIPAGQPKVRNNDCDYMFRPDTTFAYYTGLGSDYEAGAVLVLNPVDPDSPKPPPARRTPGTVRGAARRQFHRGLLHVRPLRRILGWPACRSQGDAGDDRHRNPRHRPAGRRPVQGRGCRSRRRTRARGQRNRPANHFDG